MASAIYQHLLNAHLRDINPIKAGWSDEVRGPVYFRAPRTCPILHYIVSGKGVLKIEQREFEVHANQAFLLTSKDGPAEFSTVGDLVSYHWVSFTGTESHCFSELPTVLDVPPHMLKSLKVLGDGKDCCPYELASDLFLLRATMISKETEPCDYAEYVMDYVQNAYMEPITVASIAEMMALDRSYLSRIFKKKTGQTLQNYIHEVRVQEAKRLLMENYNVTEVANMCGFRDAFVFSKLFTQLTGMSPTEWMRIVSLNMRTGKNYFTNTNSR